ncbi:MAG: ATP-binding cassette domain-containing protein, partial [Acidimicrobiia bacterium]|nr:ATP-binding cassette domain-containing protein [Acidimicrobiia bacterium]
DTTSAARTRRYRAGQKSAGRRITAVRDETQRAAEHLASFSIERDHRAPISFGAERAPRKVLASAQGDLSVGGRVLAPDLDVAIERDTRLWISGPNGAGKTTLLLRLRDSWTAPPDRLLYLPQDLDLEQSKTVFGEIVARSGTALGETMQIFARLGGDPGSVLSSVLPSVGELRKLLIADALAREAWCLMLDEPTHHLDLETVETMEQALADYPGAIVVVSHDRIFAESVTAERLALGAPLAAPR